MDLGNGAFEVNGSAFASHTGVLTPQQVRDIILSDRISSGPGVDIRTMPTQEELDNLLEMAKDAIVSGRLIDFGHWPNTAIKETGARGGRLYNDAALGHPFSKPYLMLHTWNDAETVHPVLGVPMSQPASCLYLVNPHPKQGETCITFEACLFECLLVAGVKTLAVGDRVLFDGDMSKGQHQFFAEIIPYAFRWASDPRMMAALTAQLPPNTSFIRMAASNVIDPIMMGLLILNTRGTRQETVYPPPKLAKARQKSGKPPIPSFRRVDSLHYTTALQARRGDAPHGTPKGTHASPVTHLRMGHWRRLDEAGTKRTFIQDTLVNATAEMRQQFKSTRSHYSVKPAPNAT